MCIEDDLFRRYRRLRSSSDSNTPPGTSFFIVTSVSIDDYQAVLNCSTPKRVSHDKLDWYFRAHSSNLPRVIWQRGRSNIHRYTAFSPDQYQHYLRIKPINFSDSGFYTCLDQTSGFYDEIELFVRKLFLASSILFNFALESISNSCLSFTSSILKYISVEFQKLILFGSIKFKLIM